MYQYFLFPAFHKLMHVFSFCDALCAFPPCPPAKVIPENPKNAASNNPQKPNLYRLITISTLPFISLSITELAALLNPDCRHYDQKLKLLRGSLNIYQTLRLNPQSNFRSYFAHIAKLDLEYRKPRRYPLLLLTAPTIYLCS